MNHDHYSPDYIRNILRSVKTIALVGASANDTRPSYFVMKYLLEKGYRVIPINPGLAGQQLLGQKVFASLSDVDEKIDMIDVFRASEAAEGIVKEALTLSPKPAVIWMQLGVRHDEAAGLAENNGMHVVMNRCPKMEFGKLSGEWAWVGGNAGVISSKRQQLNTNGRFQSLGLGPDIKAK